MIKRKTFSACCKKPDSAKVPRELRTRILHFLVMQAGLEFAGGQANKIRVNNFRKTVREFRPVSSFLLISRVSFVTKREH